MKYILIPVKDLSRAKQRLAALLSQPARTALAQLLMERTFAQAAGTTGCDGVAVVTNYAPAIDLAQHYGFAVIRESEQISESASVDYGSKVLAERGVLSVLRLPIDLPLIETADIEMLLSHIRTHPSVLLVPSRDGTGTNAIARTPPALFPSHFGPGSLAAHQAEAVRLAVDLATIIVPRIALDVDDPGDVAYVLDHCAGSPVRDFLLRHTSMTT